MYEQGYLIILKSNTPRELIIEFCQSEEMQASLDEAFIATSARLIQQIRNAYEKQAK